MKRTKNLMALLVTAALFLSVFSFGVLASDPELSVSITPDGTIARITGDTAGLYARVALVVDNGGQSGLYIAQVSIQPGGTVNIPELAIPGLTVKGVNIALVRTLEDILSSTPAAVSAAFLLIDQPNRTPAPLPASTPVPTSPPAPISTPEPAAEPTPMPGILQRISGMSLTEKIWQMMILRPTDLDAGSRRTVEPEMEAALSDWPVGGIFLNTDNMRDKEQVAELIADMQNMSELPLLVMCDEEGGTVSRLMRTVGTTWVNSMLSYKNEGTETAYKNARMIGSDMSALGFNLDLAPVADVWSNPSNTVIGSRAYSDDFAQAAELISAAVEGFHAGGVGCTLKHFPGHGSTAEDTHYGAAYVYKTADELRAQELLTFQAGINAGADAVMIGHLIVPELSDEPALFSCAVVTELLREELGFEGVVLTDALEMQAVSAFYDTAETAVRAVQAGVDMLLCPADPAAAVNALIAAVKNGSITEARIDESVERILALKEARGVLP